MNPVPAAEAPISGRPAGRRRILLGGGAVALATWLCLSPPAFADETWTGGSGNWTDPTQWNGGAVPNSSDDTVSIGGNLGNPAGQVTINQAGQTTGNIQVGTDAASSLTIEGNGSLTTTGASTAAGVTGSILFGAGTLTVTGPQASLTVHGTDDGSDIGDLVLGRTNIVGGVTNVFVSDGAHVTTDRTYIGEEPNGSPVNGGVNVTLTDVGTVWDAGAGGVIVGGTGGGAPGGVLTIENGAAMTATGGGADIGYGTDGAVTVTGAGSKLAVDFGITVGVTRPSGAAGNGTLTIENGGEVDAPDLVSIGDGAGSTGTLNLNNGVLNTTNGMIVGNEAGSSGTVNVNGGELNATFGVSIGFGTGSSGTLNLNSGELNTSNNVTVGNQVSSSGTLNLNGTSGARAILETSLFNKGDGDALVNFDGGILRASSSSAEAQISGFDLDDLNIMAGNAFIDTNGVVILAQSPFSGVGALIKQGAGTMIMTAANTYTGPSEVAMGTLVVGDSATPTATITSDVTVDSGATLAGFGTVGGVINNGRVMAGDPGGSLGTLTATGNYAQSTGATLATYVTQPAASLLQVNGTSSLAGRVIFTYQPGAYVPAVYPILTSTSGVSGQFDFAAESGAIPLNLVRAVVYLPGQVNLVLSLPTVADTGDDDSIFIDTSGTAQRNTQHATSFLLDDVRTKCEVTDKTCFWINPLGHFASFDGHGDANSFTADTGGFLAGAHRLVGDNLTLGVGAGYEYTGIATGDSSGNVDTARVFAYGNLDLAPVVLSGTIGYAHDWFDTDRANANGLLGVDSANESHQASEYSAGLQVALPTSIGAVNLRPKAGLQYAYIDESSFDESNAPPLNLHGDSYSHSSLRSFIGLGLSRQFAIDDLTLTPALNLGYARELLATAQGARLSIDGLPSFRPDNPVTSRNIITAGIGLDLASFHGIEIAANYDANIYVGDGVDHTVRLQGRWTF